MSAVRGIDTVFAMRPTAASTSSAGAFSPSAYPSDATTPPLVLATAGKPRSSMMRELTASQAFTRTRGSPPLWSARSRSALSSGATGLPGDAGALELVEVGPADQLVDDPLDRLPAVEARPVAIHVAHEDGLVVGDEGRDAEDAPAGDPLPVLGLDRLEGAAGLDLGGQ